MPSRQRGRITGKDKGLQFPEQQGVSLTRVGDYTIVHPYGLFADLPADVIFIEIAPGIAIPVTEQRPSDTERGESVFFHPATNTRIIARNNGDLDIEVTDGTTDGKGKVNINAAVTNLGEGGKKIARLGDEVEVTIPANSITDDQGHKSPTADLIVKGKITTSGVNTSI